ncbi:MAG: M14 family zinc carboxypeptidase [Gemmatimonadota bacterium]
MRNPTKEALVKALMKLAPAVAALALMLAAPAETAAQGSDPQHTVQIDFNRWHDNAELISDLERIERAWPGLTTLEKLGESSDGRDLVVMTINNPETGPPESKAAMYIEANVHGNEIQGAEVILYTAWYLMENYGRIDEITRLVNERVFYLVPTVNPDGRDYFLHGSGSGSRTGHVPKDDDNDGLYEEDGPDDLNGNGNIEQIRKYVPGQGTHRISRADPRVMEQVPFGETGDWIMLGSEGIDNDGDGRVNEDPPGSYDGNRNWGSDWQPQYIQGGANDYPFQLPEARAVNDFLMAHPNIGGVQSYHNSGGMILRGPGAEWQGEYPRADIQVYDELGEQGERILPYYDYIVIWSGLYTVHGGFTDWTNDGLGIVSFSNELWNGGQYFNSPDLKEQQQNPNSPISGQGASYWFDDYLEFGDQFVDWADFEHPEYGTVQLGGWKKLRGRIPPRFMNEELSHRNMAFTLYHADQMPRVELGETRVERIDGDVWRVWVDITNPRVIPTITARAAQNGVVRPDLITLDGAQIISAAWVNNKHNPGITDLIDQQELERIIVRNGHPGQTTRTLEYLVRGTGNLTFTYDSQKGGRVSQRIQLR